MRDEEISALGDRRGFVLVTRPREDSPQTLRYLARRGWRGLAVPAVTVAPTGEPPPFGMNQAQAIILTSGNGLRALPTGWEPPPHAGLTLAVGDRTAALAKRAGLPSPISAGGNGEDLLRLCRERLPPGAPVLQIAGQQLGLSLSEALQRHGHPVARWQTYRTAPARRMNLETRWIIGRGRASGVLLLSPRSAQGFAGLMQRHGLWSMARRLCFACISPATAQSLLDSAGVNPLLTVCIAQKPDLAHTLDSLVTAWRRCGPPGRPRWVDHRDG